LFWRKLEIVVAMNPPPPRHQHDALDLPGGEERRNFREHLVEIVYVHCQIAVEFLAEIPFMRPKPFGKPFLHGSPVGELCRRRRPHRFPAFLAVHRHIPCSSDLSTFTSSSPIRAWASPVLAPRCGVMYTFSSSASLPR